MWLTVQTLVLEDIKWRTLEFSQLLLLLTESNHSICSSLVIHRISSSCYQSMTVFCKQKNISSYEPSVGRNNCCSRYYEWLKGSVKWSDLHVAKVTANAWQSESNRTDESDPEILKPDAIDVLKMFSPKKRSFCEWQWKHEKKTDNCLLVASVIQSNEVVNRWNNQCLFKIVTLSCEEYYLDGMQHSEDSGFSSGSACVVRW